MRVLTLRILTFAMIGVLLCAATAFAVFTYFDEDDPMWVFDAPIDNNFEVFTPVWESYPNVQAFLDAYDVATIDTYSFDHLEDVVLSYTATANEFAFRPSIYFVCSVVEVFWDWIEHPHVHFLDYPEQLNDSQFHPSDYEDILGLIQGAGIYNRNTGEGEANGIAVFNRIQEMVDDARDAWGLALFPGTPPQEWQAGIPISGESWWRIEGSPLDYRIANINIDAESNTRSPEHSAAYRLVSQRRYMPYFDRDDIYKDMSISDSLENLGVDEVFVDHVSHNVYLRLDTDEIIEVFNQINRHADISIEVGNRWYIGRVTHRAYNPELEAIELRTDPHAENGEFSNGESAVVQINVN